MNRPHIIVLLDLSGSMRGIRDVAIRAVDKFIEPIRAMTNTPLVTLASFNEGMTIYYSRVPAEKAPLASSLMLSVAGDTEVYNAVYGLLTSGIRNGQPVIRKDEQTLIAIVTDGWSAKHRVTDAVAMAAQYPLTFLYCAPAEQYGAGHTATAEPQARREPNTNLEYYETPSGGVLFEPVYNFNIPAGNRIWVNFGMPESIGEMLPVFASRAIEEFVTEAYANPVKAGDQHKGLVSNSFGFEPVLSCPGAVYGGKPMIWEGEPGITGPVDYTTNQIMRLWSDGVVQPHPGVAWKTWWEKHQGELE